MRQGTPTFCKPAKSSCFLLNRRARLARFVEYAVAFLSHFVTKE